jgi:hypothetical protein
MFECMRSEGLLRQCGDKPQLPEWLQSIKSLKWLVPLAGLEPARP